MNSHYPWAYVIKCKPKILLKLLKKAKEDFEKEKLWEQWLQIYPYMVVPSPHTKDGKPLVEFKSFNDFEYRIKNPISTRPKEEILKEVEEIRAKLGR